MAESKTKLERLAILFDRLRAAPPAKSGQEAMDMLNRMLEEVEDEFSGHPIDPGPPRATTPRMYAPRDDSIIIQSDGRMIAIASGHTIIYGMNGSIAVEQRPTGRVVFEKQGGG